MGHIELGKWADLVILAPATADLLARVAAGMANDLLTTVCLATDAPIAAAYHEPTDVSPPPPLLTCHKRCRRARHVLLVEAAQKTPGSGT